MAIAKDSNSISSTIDDSPQSSRSTGIICRTGARTVGVKTGGSPVGDPELWILDPWGTRDKGDDVYPGSGPLGEVKPYILLDYIEVYMMVTESIYHKSDELNPR